jgi:hypothetical protein
MRRPRHARPTRGERRTLWAILDKEFFEFETNLIALMPKARRRPSSRSFAFFANLPEGSPVQLHVTIRFYGRKNHARASLAEAMLSKTKAPATQDEQDVMAAIFHSVAKAIPSSSWWGLEGNSAVHIDRWE